MRAIIASFLAAAVFLFTATIAGMGAFGMGTMAGADMTHGPATDCVEHCLASVPDASTPAMPFLALAVLAVVAVVLPQALHAVVAAAPLRERWREAFARLLLRQSLATVILRN